MSKNRRQVTSVWWKVAVGGAGAVVWAVPQAISLFRDSPLLTGWKAYGLLVASVLVIGAVIWQLVDTELALRGLQTSRPQISVNGIDIRKGVRTTDFVTKIPRSLTGYEAYAGGAVTQAPDQKDNPAPRYTGGTGSSYGYIPAFREQHGSTSSIEAETREQTYAVINFANNPERRADVHDAKSVVARIRYFDRDRKDLLGREIRGLWAGYEPTTDAVRKRDSEYTTIDIPANGDIAPLCIAVKSRDDVDCYAYCLDSYVDGVTFLCNEQLRLRGGLIMVQVVIAASNMDDVTFTFRLTNPGRGRDISLAEIRAQNR